jgi:hypothetical protein
MRFTVLLSKEFFLLLATAAGIALHITNILFDRILFSQITNHAPMHLTEMLGGRDLHHDSCLGHDLFTSIKSCKEWIQRKCLKTE